MNKRIKSICIWLLSATCLFGQSHDQTVFTSDIDRFWIAYDSVQTIADSVKQVQIMQSLYVDQGTVGLKAFMVARNYNAAEWVRLIRKYPKFWKSIRLNTLSAKSKQQEIEKSIEKLKSLYPDLKKASMYFTVGGLRSGGTTREGMVLIGAEIATGTASTDVSEFPTKWLAGVFNEQRLDNIVPLNVHEYIHTQQHGYASNLLGQAILEGSCNFIAELVIGRPMQNNYIKFGIAHEEELKEKFKHEMFSDFYAPWLYNGGNAKTMADLGYFMGYAICKSYYAHASDKKQAVKEIIELKYSDSNALESFLKKSRYYTGPIDKKAMLEEFDRNRPHVMRVEPFATGDSVVDMDIKQLKIVFSESMDTTGYSINYGDGGKEHYPITGVGGFSQDAKAFTIKLGMKAGFNYEFVITGQSFKSISGYPLKEQLVKFSTRK